MVFRQITGVLLLLAIMLAMPLAGCSDSGAVSTPTQTSSVKPTPALTSTPATTLPTTTTPATTKPIATTTPATTATGKMSILSHSSYIKHGKWTGLFSGEVYEGDFLHIVGEIQNDGQVNVKDFEMAAVYFDSNGTTLPVTGRIYLDESPELLAPGEKGAFLLILFDEETSKKVSSYQLSIEFSTTAEQPYALNIMRDRGYTDKWGIYKVLGEVENAGEGNIESVRICATFYDEAGRVVDMDYTFTSLSMLVPGQKSPFELWPSRGNDVESIIKSYSLQAQCRETDRAVYRGFQILGDTSRIGTLQDYIVAGQIKNTGDQDATFIKIVATFYRADNTIATVNFTYADPIDLKAGETGQFELSTYPYELAPGEIVRYSLEFECLNY